MKQGFASTVIKSPAFLFTSFLMVLVTLLGLAVTPLAVAGIYKWVDENGQVHFGDKPPERRGSSQSQAPKVETIKIKQHSGWQAFDVQVLLGAADQGDGPVANPDDPDDLVVNLSVEEQQALKKLVAENVSQVYEFYDRILYFDFYRTVPVSIRLLTNRQRYIDYFAAEPLIGSMALMTRGVYLSQSNQIVMYLQETPELTLATLRHETSHAIFANQASKMPRWLNEGVAEQMETLSRDGKSFVIRQHPENHAILLANRSKTQNVLEFVEQDNHSWHEGLTNGPNQSMAGQLVYRLFSTSYGRSFVTKLMQAHKRGVNVRSYYLLDQEYIGGRSAFMLHWDQWIATGMAKPLQIKLD